MNRRHETDGLCKLWAMVAVMISFGLLSACSSSTAPEEPEDTSAWGRFERKDYEAALVGFQAELEEDPSATSPQVGIGWCYLSLDSLLVAKKILTDVLSVDPQPLDAASGLALTLSATREFKDCLTWVDVVLAEDPAYEFGHDREVNADKLSLVAARASYLRNDYQQSYEYLSRIDGAKTLDPQARNFPEQLIAEILRLEAAD